MRKNEVLQQALSGLIKLSVLPSQPHPSWSGRSSCGGKMGDLTRWLCTTLLDARVLPACPARAAALWAWPSAITLYVATHSVSLLRSRRWTIGRFFVNTWRRRNSMPRRWRCLRGLGSGTSPVPRKSRKPSRSIVFFCWFGLVSDCCLWYVEIPCLSNEESQICNQISVWDTILISGGESSRDSLDFPTLPASISV